MSKARTLADFISDGSEFADGTISVAEVSGAAPLASPTFTGTVTVPTLTPTTITGGNISGDVRFGTNVNAIFGGGASDYLNIYSDGTNKYIQDTGSGSLFIRGSDLVLEDASGYDYIAMSDTGNGGSVAIKHSGDTKFITSTTGVDITGEVKADKFTNDEALPDVRPSLLLDFANSKTLDPRITFTRGSTATYWDGKTTTKAEENLQGGSTLFNTTYWLFAQCTFTADYTTAPDGTSTAVRLIEDSSPNYHYLHGQTSNTVSTTSGTTYTWSIYAKKGVGTSAPDIVQLCFRGNTHSTAYANFNISTGAVTGSADVVSSSITSVGNGWYRLVVTATANSSGSGGGGVFSFANNGPSATRLPIYTGNTNADVLLWGPQFEQRSSATAYTPTTSSPIVKYQPTLQTAASGEARFDHDPVTGESKGLLIEEARTNLATYSEAFNSWTKLYSTVESNAAIAPDGTLTADKLVPDATNTTAHRVSIPQGFTLGTSYAFSVYAKAGEKQYIDVRWYDGNTNAARVVFDVSNGTISNTHAGTGVVQDVGNGWYRCSVYASATNTSISGLALIYVEDAGAGAVTYQGNGYDGLYLWGAQFEVGAFPTSYIPTSGSTVTRSLDSAEITGTSFDFFNNQESTFYAELDMTYSGDNSKGILSVNTDISGASGRLINMYLSSGLQYYYDSYSFGTTVASGSGGSAPPSKISLGFSTTSYLATSDEQLVGNTSGSYYLDEAVSMKIGGTYNGNGYPLNGHLKKIACYPKQLTSATLQAMTEA